MMKLFTKGCCGLILGSLGVLSAGCGDKVTPMPQTYLVSGSVLSKKGTPFGAGLIQFKPESKEDITVLGDVAPDGTFSLRTLKGTTLVKGAPPGSYEVVISAAMGSDQKLPFSPFTLPKKYQIERNDTRLEIRADPPPKTY